MSNRLNKDREIELQPKRMEYAIQQLNNFVSIIEKDETKIVFPWKGERVTFYPYSGWHTGKSIIDGRGIEKLLNQLK